MLLTEPLKKWLFILLDNKTHTHIEPHNLNKDTQVKRQQFLFL